jgi:trafficking protein particle complex subunit 3
MATTSKQYKAIGDDLWKGRPEKVVCSLRVRRPPYSSVQNAELFALTYGALVVQLIQDYEDYAEVNKQLEKMGYNIGTRLIEDFLAKSALGRCADFREVGEVVAKVLRPFLPLVILTDAPMVRLRSASNPSST